MVREGADCYPAYTIGDPYHFLSNHELRRSIGSEFEYSNIGVALLAHPEPCRAASVSA